MAAVSDLKILLLILIGIIFLVLECFLSLLKNLPQGQSICIMDFYF